MEGRRSPKPAAARSPRRAPWAAMAVVVAAGLLPLAARAIEPAPGPRFFERMKSLAGEWEGTFEWSEGRSGSGAMRAVYRLTGNGSALVEDLVVGDATLMSSVYHLDGADLRMTHYCAAQNQPRLRGTRIDEAAGVAEFEFLDVTNGAERPGRVEAFSIRMPGDDELELRFRFGGSPRHSGLETIRLRRRAPAPEPPPADVRDPG